MKSRDTIAHILALVTISVWGTTFIATKLLLDSFSPIQILVIRFVIGYLSLLLYDLIVYSKKKSEKRALNWRQEFIFMGAGLTGVVMYYLLENIALTMTYASNVGILVSLAPLTTALLGLIFLKDEKIKYTLFIGFIVASIGAVLVMFNGAIEFHLSIKGDLLALLATFGWAFYSLLLKRIDNEAYPVTTYTRKIFFYGIIWMIPVLSLYGFSFSNISLKIRDVALLLFLGVGASASCFVFWNYAVKKLGVYKTSAYIYLTPLISLFTAALVLKERVTVMAFGGCLLILVGLYISERKQIGKKSKITTSA